MSDLNMPGTDWQVETSKSGRRKGWPSGFFLAHSFICGKPYRDSLSPSEIEEHQQGGKHNSSCGHIQTVYTQPSARHDAKFRDSITYCSWTCALQSARPEDKIKRNGEELLTTTALEKVAVPCTYNYYTHLTMATNLIKATETCQQHNKLRLDAIRSAAPSLPATFDSNKNNEVNVPDASGLGEAGRSTTGSVPLVNSWSGGAPADMGVDGYIEGEQNDPYSYFPADHIARFNPTSLSTFGLSHHRDQTQQVPSAHDAHFSRIGSAHNVPFPFDQNSAVVPQPLEAMSGLDGYAPAIMLPGGMSTANRSELQSLTSETNGRRAGQQGQDFSDMAELLLSYMSRDEDSGNDATDHDSHLGPLASYKDSAGTAACSGDK